MKKNIILLGGSNSLNGNGFWKGLKEGIEKLNLTLEENKKSSSSKTKLEANGGRGRFEFYNLVWGANDIT